MKVKVEQSGGCRRVIHVEVPKERVATEYRDVIAAYAKSARIPGFRPGRAPLALVERTFAKDILQETRERMVPRCYHEVLAQEKLEPVAVVDVKEEGLAKDRDFFFDVVVDVAPTFEVPEYRGIALKRQAVEVSDAQVDEAISRLRDRMATFADVARPIQKSDLAQVDFDGTCDGKSLSELAPEAPGLGSGKDFWMMIQEPELLPGMTVGLVGASAGETRTVSVDFPSDFRVPALAGRKAQYTVLVKAVREKSLPPIDAEFLKMLQAESEDDLKARIRADLQRNAESEERRRLRNEVVGHLLRETKMDDLPRALVEEEARSIVQDIVYENTMRGATKEQIEERKDDILNVATQSSAERVKLNHILRRIAERENIVVEDREVDYQVGLMAGRQRVQPAQMRAELEQRGALEHIRRDIRSSKTLDFLLEQAQVAAPSA